MLSNFCVCLTYVMWMFLLCLSTYFQVHLIFFMSSYLGSDSLLRSLRVSGAAEGRGYSPRLRVSVLGPSPQHKQPDAGQPYVHSPGEGDDEDGQTGAVDRRAPVQTRPRASPQLARAFCNHFTLPLCMLVYACFSYRSGKDVCLNMHTEP